MARKPWVAVDCDVHTNPKIIDLAAALKVSDIDLIVGKLCRLWAWAKLRGIEDGRLGRLPDQEIADIMRWRKSAKALVAALVEFRLLDQTEDGGYVLHDWYELNGKATEKARKDRERKG